RIINRRRDPRIHVSSSFERDAALSRHVLLFHGFEDVRRGVVSVREPVSASRALVITRFPRAPTVFPVVRGAVAFAVNVAHRSDRSFGLQITHRPHPGHRSCLCVLLISSAHSARSTYPDGPSM